MNTALSLLPDNDARELFARLLDAAKEEWLKWAEAILDIQASLSGPSFSSLPSVKRSSLYSHWAARLNTSTRSVRRKFSEYIHGTELYPAGDWRILVNHSKAGSLFSDSLITDSPITDSLPPAFLDYLRLLASGNQRKTRPAIRLLYRHLDAWRAGRSWTFKGVTYTAIPGYNSPPLPRSGSGRTARCPEGWSERNLYHKLNTPQTRTEFAIARIGTATAMQTLPPIPRTRAQIRFLEYVFFDDVWIDRKCLVPGYPQPVRLLQLGCLDYATATYLKFGQRPELPTDNGTRERIKERDMLWLVAMLLEDWGYPLDYDMHLVLEHGTATLREHDARALYDWSGGRIKPCYITLEGDMVFVWDERARGNPRGKAPLESWHNLFHNENAFTAGQVGMDRDHSPAILPAQEREASSLVTAAHFLTPKQKALIGYPFPTQEQAYWETHEVISTINHRIDHRCEGFNIVADWRVRGETALHPEHEALTHAAFNELHAAGLIEFLPRPETPMERLKKLSNVPRGTINPELLRKFYEHSRTVARLQPDGTFAFRRAGKDYIFSQGSNGRAATVPSDHRSLITSGTEYLLHHAPFDPPNIHITLGGAYLSTWPRLRAPRDQKELAEAIRHKTAAINARASALRRTHADQIAAEDKRVQQNLRVLAEANLIPSPPLDSMDCGGTDAAFRSSSVSRPESVGSVPPVASTLVDAYQAEAALARERTRTREILERTAPADQSDPSDIFSEPITQTPNQPQSVTDDELNSIL